MLLVAQYGWPNIAILEFLAELLEVLPIIEMQSIVQTRTMLKTKEDVINSNM